MLPWLPIVPRAIVPDAELFQGHPAPLPPRAPTIPVTQKISAMARRVVSSLPIMSKEERHPYVDHPEQRVISLCSGVGGLDIGLRLAIPALRVVTYVEREGPAAGLLVEAIEAGEMDAAPVWTDLRTFDGRGYRGIVDGVIGGYPCQGESVAGRQRGVDDPRWLWPDVARIVRESEPRWCFFENVANHANKGFRVVGPELEEMGYRVEAGVFSAAEVGRRQ